MGDHLKTRERARAERGHDRNVGGIAPACHQDAADARFVVARIECVPVLAEINFEPGAEIHCGFVERYADIAEIAGTVSRRNVHAAAQRDREVSEVPAHAASLGMGIPRRLCRAGMGVAEGDAIVDIVADRLHQRPTLRNLREQGPRRIRQAIGLAVAAAEQIDQHLHRQVF